MRTGSKIKIQEVMPKIISPGKVERARPRAKVPMVVGDRGGPYRAQREPGRRRHGNLNRADVPQSEDSTLVSNRKSDPRQFFEPSKNSAPQVLDFRRKCQGPGGPLNEIPGDPKK